jgi:hypothetical protein
VLAALDAKYRGDREPASEDVRQVVAYAVRLGTERAFLLNPSASAPARRLWVVVCRCRPRGFDLAGDLEQSGAGVVQELSQQVKPA